ncbi:MAG: sulfotransferase domain-containing protein [Paracoccaceae bacterium]
MNTNRSTLPTTTDEMDALFAKVFREESTNSGLAFQPRPTDIIIAPFAKCGTTWLQQIAHGLRTRGSMDFEEISNVTPWIELAFELGIDLDATQVAEPRVFKSHLNWRDVPKNARYIVSFRDPSDAFISIYRFFEGFMFEPGTIDMDTFFRWRNPTAEMGERGYWHHLASWWEQRNNPDVLLLCYEDMLADILGTVRRIAAFMDIPLDDELFARVVHQASRRFMLEHKSQFDEAPFRRLISRRTGLPVDTDASKVTPGARDDPKYHLSATHQKKLEEIWQAQLSNRFGLESYKDLRHAIRTLHQTG